ncbi:MAG: SLC13 family permease [bacterium]
MSASNSSAPRQSNTASMSSFDQWRNRLGFLIAPVVVVLVWFWPLPGLSQEAHRLAAIASGVVILWFCESIPLAVTAMIGPALCVIAGVSDVKAAFAPFANPIIFLFIGSFLIAESLTLHGLGKRLAHFVLSLRIVRGSPTRIILALGILSACLSMWISNTATTAMLYPLAIATLAAWSPDREDHRSRNALTYGLLMIAYSSTIGGLATPVGTPPNLVGIEFIWQECGRRISFANWMLLIGPLSLLCWLALAILLRPSRSQAADWSEGPELILGAKAQGRLSRGEVNTLIAFGTAVTLWVLPGVIALLAGGEGELARTLQPYAAWMKGHLPEGVVGLLAGCLLFALPTGDPKHPFTLNWEDAARIDWGTILLFGGGLSIGGMAFSTGLAEALGHGIVSMTGVTSLVGLTGLCIFMASILSETTSNTASANMAVPVAISIAKAAGVDPVLPAIAACLGASCGFMLPVSTPPNAIIYGSGKVRLMTMVRMGFIFDIVIGLLMWMYLILIWPHI